jgi:Predicted endonuclease distantly related to archaeal Holliday junction resolvase
MDARMTRGREAEEMACQYLREQGFSIRHQRWQHGHKELDIVAERAQILHVVEVRSRTEPYWLAPPHTIDYLKQKNIITAAAAYIRKFGIHYEVQFDIVSVVFTPEGPELEYIPRAFYPVLRQPR